MDNRGKQKLWQNNRQLGQTKTLTKQAKAMFHIWWYESIDCLSHVHVAMFVNTRHVLSRPTYVQLMNCDRDNAVPSNMHVIIDFFFRNYEQ